MQIKTQEKEYNSLAEYFADHPDEEADFYDELARQNQEELDAILDCPEDF